ncbi:MAG: hypothetical protein SFY66_10220 [Oculatellaceae cyanobacterium bins.114]|nr:hypothetical protein [Oculatellaceae cyanobacterium bins.114]
MVWGSAAGLLLAVILFSEYWKHPEWFSSSDEYTSTSGVASLDNLPNSGQYGAFPSQEDSAIGADIDSLPVLLNDLALNSPAQTDQADATATSPSEQAVVPNGQPTPSTAPTTNPPSHPDLTSSTRRNPFAATPQNTRLFDLNLPGIDRANNPPETNNNLNSGFATGFDLLANPAQPPQSPLRSAIQQYAPRNGNDSESGNTAQRSQNNGSNTASNSNVNQSASDGRLQPNQPIPNGLLPATSLQTSPPTGTTGYTLPSILQNTPSSAPSNGNTYGNTGRSQPLPGLPTTPQLAPSVLPQTGNVGRSTVQTPTYGANQGNLVNPYNLPSSNNPRTTQPQYDAPNSQPAPFTAPHSQGGGEINTFANP